MEYIIKKCNKCGAIIQVLKDCTCNDCGVRCCNEQMKTLIPNSVDASFEKHLPVYEIKDDMVEVTVNHVMEEEHYIGWITIYYEDGSNCTKFLKPGSSATAVFEYKENAILYAYCNKHGLWETKLK